MGNREEIPLSRGTPKVQIWRYAKPGESLRQKDPVPEPTLENSPQKITARNTDGVTPWWLSRLERFFLRKAYRNHIGESLRFTYRGAR